ncbi:MAG: hypothetical protein A2W98_07570 [Bacteroidetes bacterium GWF2_33_38]|nr:MAG: hypothetical protein A2W98_07570 [Bacteroidetes bacterium GWF2_33_38]OFY89662.1 MAG: hypothetical protein A2236_01395 [Bacteroidetes bacterium RIFOXYA2_FULL_33_7]
MFFSCNFIQQNTENETIYFCDAEQVVVTLNNEILIDDSLHEYGINKIRTTEKAFSGKYSILLDSTNNYGYSIKIKNIKPYDQLNVEVWEFSEIDSAKCLIVADSKEDFFYKTGSNLSKQKNGWNLIQAQFEIPIIYNGNEITIYIWNKDKKKFLLDDFKITHIHRKVDYEAFKLDKLYLNIEKNNFDRLTQIRNEAIELGILNRQDNDFLPVSTKFENKQINGKIRLKGDWTDHLYGEKWSYRLKLNENLISGMNVFSLQNPYTRGFLNEYIFHKLLEREGILTPEYRFVEVFINQKSYGVYALEEHLSQRLMNRFNKNTGVILKFDEKPFWDEMIKKEEERQMNNLASKAEIKTYGKSKDDEAILKAIEIVDLYRKQDSTFFKYLDLSQMAKYYALCDIARAYHAMGWINLRFYYDFQKNKIEPIGYDAYTATNHMTWANPYLGFTDNHLKYKKYDAESLIYQVYDSKQFNKLYFTYLEEYSDSLYITNFFDDVKTELDFLEDQIQIEFPTYDYDYKFIKKNAQEIRASLKVNKQL